MQKDAGGGILLAAASKAAGHIAAAERRPLGEAGLQTGSGDLSMGPGQLLLQLKIERFVVDSQQLLTLQ